MQSCMTRQYFTARIKNHGVLLDHALQVHWLHWLHNVHGYRIYSNSTTGRTIFRLVARESYY